MTRGALAATLAVLALLIARATAADPIAVTFEDLARPATVVTRLDELVWALTATCDAGDALAQRRCRQLRDHRAGALAAQPLRIDAEPDALVVGPWDPARRSVAIRLVACVRCAGVEVGGQRWRILHPPPPGRTAGPAATLYDTSRAFPDETAAQAWRAVLARARIELIVRVPKRPRPAGAPTIAVEVVGWRIVDPCDGAIVAAHPSSGPAVRDAQSCGIPPG